MVVTVLPNFCAEAHEEVREYTMGFPVVREPHTWERIKEGLRWMIAFVFYDMLVQCWGSKSGILAQFGFGSESRFKFKFERKNLKIILEEMHFHKKLIGTGTFLKLKENNFTGRNFLKSV